MKTKIFTAFFILFFLSTPQSQGAPKEKWNESRSSHFIVYFKDVPPDFVKSVEETAENYYQEITRNLGFTRDQSWTWDQRAKIYIYNDVDDYIESAKAQSWSHGVADWLKKEVRTYPSAVGFFDSLLPHELGHIILREFIKNNSFVPLWFDEGVAQYQEKARRWGVNKIVKKAIEENQFVPLSELSTVHLYSDTERTFVDLFYAEAASVIYYLITELGEYKFNDLCRELRSGTRFEKAVTKTYSRFDDLDELNRAWVDYLKR